MPLFKADERHQHAAGEVLWSRPAPDFTGAKRKNIIQESKKKRGKYTKERKHKEKKVRRTEVLKEICWRKCIVGFEGHTVHKSVISST